MDRQAEFLIIGSGIAGLRAAIELEGAGTTLILTKAGPAAGNTGFAQGGIAAALGEDDSPERHAADTLAAGDGLCDEAAVRVLVEEGPDYVRQLIEWGTAFDRGPDGRPALAIEGAHSTRRVLHAGDATGREIGRALWQRASALRCVSIVPHCRVVNLLLENGRCVGAEYLTDDGAAGKARAEAVLLATGGAGQVYSQTTNPSVATGDGIAIAYRAGAQVADLEFVQFHPTALDLPGQPRFLLSEALRGEGARLLNVHGERFMPRYDPAGELAPRDRVARAIEREARATGHPVYLSLEHLNPEFVHTRFPLISEACRRAGLDLARDRIPVGPAAHYVMGGVRTDLDGRTSVPGLYAAGEVACTGVHGANRLASNSLLEGLVFGARAGRSMRAAESGWPVFSGALSDVTESDDRGPALPSATTVRSLMWRQVGLFRDRAGLAAALEVLEPAWSAAERRLQAGRTVTAGDWEIADRIAVARLITRAAMRREESRGAHYRTDFPERDDLHWKRRVIDRWERS